MVEKVNAIQTTDTKISKVEKKILNHGYAKYIIPEEFSKLAIDNFTVRLAQTKLASKSDVADFVRETDFDNK